MKYNNNSNNEINNTNNCTKIFIFLKSRATGYPANRIQSEREIKKACWYYNNIDDANSVYKWNNFSSLFYSNLQFLFSDCTKPKEMTTDLGGVTKRKGRLLQFGDFHSNLFDVIFSEQKIK